MRHPAPLLPLLLLAALLLAACDSRPKSVLSRSQMEDVLYDFHLAQGLLDQLPGDERADRSQDYLDAVFAKHHITEAQFDSSVTYYNRHTKELHKIYTSLKARYTAANEEIQLINGNNDMTAIFTTGGDTTNLWTTTPLLLLRHKPLLSHESFTLQADTTFYRRDHFILTLTPHFIHEQGDNTRTPSLSVGLTLHYASGKHTGTTRTLTAGGTQQLTLQASADEDIRSITGFFHYRGISPLRNLCLVDGISLVRMHEKAPLPQPADTLQADSATTDTLPQPELRRLTPEELRQQNQSRDKIQIQAAPAVRTPNSIGPRRKANKKTPHATPSRR